MTSNHALAHLVAYTVTVGERTLRAGSIHRAEVAMGRLMQDAEPGTLGTCSLQGRTMFTARAESLGWALVTA